MTPTARLVAAAQAVIDGSSLIEQGDFGTRAEVPLPLMAKLVAVVHDTKKATTGALDATPPAAAPTAEPTDEELADAYHEVTGCDDSDPVGGRRALYRLGVERERARCVAVLRERADERLELAEKAVRNTDGYSSRWHGEACKALRDAADALEDDHG